MVELTPVRAYRPSGGAPGADGLVCPVYDTLSEGELARYASRSDNAARFVPRPPGVSREAFVRGAAAAVGEAIASGVFARDDRPSFYVYGIRYRPPADVLEALDESERRPEYLLLGLVGGLDLDRVAHGQVALHERTFADRVGDRVALTDATGLSFAPIVMGYHAEGHHLNDRLEQGLGLDRRALSFDGAVPPVATATLEGTEHRLWRIDATEEVDALRHAVEPLRLLVLDGHHRYTAAARRQYEGRRSVPLVMLVNGDDRALLLLPWHRVLPAPVAAFDLLIEAARNAFPEVLEVATRLSPEGAIARLHAMRREGVRGFLAVSGDHWFEIRGSSSGDVGADFDLLHAFLEDTLEIDPESLEFVRSPRTAIERVQRKASGQEPGTALLLPGLTTRGVEERAFGRGEVMVQKSTMFLPKVIEGLIFAPVDPDVGREPGRQ